MLVQSPSGSKSVLTLVSAAAAAAALIDMMDKRFSYEEYRGREARRIEARRRTQNRDRGRRVDETLLKSQKEGLIVSQNRIKVSIDGSKVVMKSVVLSCSVVPE